MEKQNASAQRLPSADMLERWPQVCRLKIMFTSLSTNHFVSTATNAMKCLVNWIPLRIRVGSRSTQPHLNAFLVSFKIESSINVPDGLAPLFKQNLGFYCVVFPVLFIHVTSV